VSRVLIIHVPDVSCSVFELFIFVRHRKEWDYIDSTLPDAYVVYDFEKSQPRRLPICTAIYKTLSSDSAKSTLFYACFRHVATRAVLLTVYYQSQTHHLS
jgi:hypothetical protein